MGNVTVSEVPKIDMHLTHVNSMNVAKIAEKLDTTPEDVVNKLIYILTSDTSGIRDDIEVFCETGINTRKKMTNELMLQYKAKHLQQMENLADLKKMMEFLEK